MMRGRTSSSGLAGLTIVSQSGWFGAPTTSSPSRERVDGAVLMIRQAGSWKNIISNLLLQIWSRVSIQPKFLATLNVNIRRPDSVEVLSFIKLRSGGYESYGTNSTCEEYVPRHIV